MTAPTPPSVAHSSQDETPPTRGALRPRTIDIRKSVATYSRFVSTMKVLLPTVAIFLLALVLILPQLGDDTDQFTAKIVPASGDSSDTPSLVNARYHGTDDLGRPFTVTAESVLESSDDRDNIDLVAPQADMSLNDGTWLMVGAETGQYHRERQVLNLYGTVNLFQDQGYELHTESATIFLEEGRACSSAPVRTQGPFGQLESQGFELKDKGKTVYFTGPARLVLNASNGGAATP
jgi:lipopolysaccharide export system protein LptC